MTSIGNHHCRYLCHFNKLLTERHQCAENNLGLVIYERLTRASRHNECSCFRRYGEWKSICINYNTMWLDVRPRIFVKLLLHSWFQFVFYMTFCCRDPDLTKELKNLSCEFFTQIGQMPAVNQNASRRRSIHVVRRTFHEKFSKPITQKEGKNTWNVVFATLNWKKNT